MIGTSRSRWHHTHTLCDLKSSHTYIQGQRTNHSITPLTGMAWGNLSGWYRGTWRCIYCTLWPKKTHKTCANGNRSTFHLQDSVKGCDTRTLQLHHRRTTASKFKPKPIKTKNVDSFHNNLKIVRTMRIIGIWYYNLNKQTCAPIHSE